MKVCSSCQHCYDDPAAACTDEGHPALSEARPGSCEMIAGYTLEFLLDSEGNCETYQASTRSGQPCFINILPAGDEAVEEFRTEAETAAKFFHPNVAEVYEAGTLESGEAYVVTEKPGGQTLRELLNNVGVPSLLTSIQVARQAAEALYALHQNGMRHRAVCPENIILTSDAEQRLLVKIQNADLGAARSRSIVTNKFLNASELNSLKYFAPELNSGDEARPQSDVYSLGIVFYEMLAGSPPFDAPTAAGLIDLHCNHQPPEVSVDRFDLRMLITHTLKESLQKQPKQRHPSANALARQLRHIEQLATHISTPPAAGVAPSAPARPTPLASSAAASTVPTAQAVMRTKIDRKVEKPAFEKAAPEPIVTKAETEVRAVAHVETVAIEPERAAAVEPIPAVVYHESHEAADPEIPEFKAAPVKIEWEPAEDDIRSEAEVREILIAESEADSTQELTASNDDPIDLPPVETAVEANPPEAEYLPEPVGKPQRRRAAAAVGGGTFFSEYEGRSPARISLDYRAFVAGGCFIVLAAIFLAGSAVLSESVGGTDASLSAVSAKAPAATNPVPPEKPTEVAAVVAEDLPHESETYLPAEDLRPEQLKPLTDGEAVLRSAAPPPTRNAAAPKVLKSDSKTTAASPKTAAPAATSAKVEKMPDVRSTIVISPKNSREQPRIQIVPRPEEQRRNASLTRPRIVVGSAKP